MPTNVTYPVDSARLDTPGGSDRILEAGGLSPPSAKVFCRIFRRAFSLADPPFLWISCDEVSEV